MKIIGIGTDLVSVERIARIWEQHGLRFAARILTEDEKNSLSQAKSPIAFLAKRYAAKEAVAKAVGTGFRPQGLLLSEIGVVNDTLGRPHLKFFGRTQKIILELGVKESFLSLSDEQEMALAFVVLLGY